MPKVKLTGRLAALVGVGAAVSTAALVAFAAPAFAADSNKSTSCTDKVNIRSKPETSAPVIGSCKAGQKVTTDETRSGFSHLTSENGWVSNQYIKDASDSSEEGSPSSSDSDDPNSDNADSKDDNNGSNDGNDDSNDDSDHGDHHDDGGDSGGGSGLLGF